MSIGSFSTSWRRRAPTHKTRILHSKTLSTSESLLGGPRVLTQQMLKRRVVSAWGSSLRRQMASKTLGMRARIRTKEVCKQVHLKTEVVRRNGQRSKNR